MIVSCPGCSARFAVKAELIGTTGRKVRCARCRHQWFQEPDEDFVLASVNSMEFEITPEPENTEPVPEGSNLPAMNSAKSNSTGMLPAFAALLAFFVFTVSIVSYETLLPKLHSYYDMLGIYDASGVILHNVSVEEVKSDRGSRGLLVRGSIVNGSGFVRKVPDLRITLLDDGKKPLRTIVLDSAAAEFSPGDGVDFRNLIPNLPKDAAKVVMDVGSKVDLASR